MEITDVTMYIKIQFKYRWKIRSSINSEQNHTDFIGMFSSLSIAFESRFYVVYKFLRTRKALLCNLLLGFTNEQIDVVPIHPIKRFV